MRVMKALLLAAVVLSSVAPADHGDRAQLAQLKLDDVRITAGWVESGKAPARIVARKSAGGVVTRTRPLCPYPQHAVDSGTGSTDQAESFVCR
jgi:feruloyl esterase